MTFSIDVLTLVAFLGTFHGLILAVVFWLKNKNISNRIFAFLLLATSIRIAKNIFVHLEELNPGLFQSVELWRSYVYIGISHQFAIGPLLYLYFRSKLNVKFNWRASYYAHFVPYAILVLVSSFLSWAFWKNGGLWLSYLSILLYFLLAVRTYMMRKNGMDEGTLKWLKGLLIGIGVLLFAYSPALFRYIGYVGGAILYVVMLLASGYFLLVGKGILFRKKYETSSLKEEQAIKIRRSIEQVMEETEPYLNPELSLKSLAESIDVAPHHLSRVINQEFKMSFADYINAFRLKESEKRLVDPAYHHLKISALAFECGFNSVPTFNTLFKKVYKMTPSQFRDEGKR